MSTVLLYKDLSYNKHEVNLIPKFNRSLNLEDYMICVYFSQNE